MAQDSTSAQLPESSVAGTAFAQATVVAPLPVSFPGSAIGPNSFSVASGSSTGASSSFSQPLFARSTALLSSNHHPTTAMAILDAPPAASVPSTQSAPSLIPPGVAPACVELLAQPTSPSTAIVSSGHSLAFALWMGQSRKGTIVYICSNWQSDRSCMRAMVFNPNQSVDSGSVPVVIPTDTEEDRLPATALSSSLTTSTMLAPSSKVVVPSILTSVLATSVIHPFTSTVSGVSGSSPLTSESGASHKSDVVAKAGTKASTSLALCDILPARIISFLHQSIGCSLPCLYCTLGTCCFLDPYCLIVSHLSLNLGRGFPKIGSNG
ncbi:uncharacterized protein [Primulina huaijiensis]|uniref:uncharacterized protein n=1 Tax=Primulina huaijiensis TaxID=1492673 RepID=UPI003CC734DE